MCREFESRHPLQKICAPALLAGAFLLYFLDKADFKVNIIVKKKRTDSFGVLKWLFILPYFA